MSTNLSPILKKLGLSIFLAFVFSMSVSHADTLNDLITGATGTESAPTENKVITTESNPQKDKEIRERLQEIYAELDNLSALSVSVNKSVITLRGEVTSAAEEEKAVSLANQIEGVVEVENELEITRSVEKRLQTTWNKVLTLLKDISNALPLILVSLFIFILCWLLGGWLSNRQWFFRRITPNHFIANLLGQITHLFLIIIGLVLALSLLDATALLGTIMGAAGIFGLAIGFAVRDTVENYIASILLSLRNPFQVHDFVEISGQLGSVARLTTRATILIAPDGNHVRIPNAEVFKAIIINYTRNPERRFQFDLGIDVAQDLNEAQQLAIDTLNEMEGVLDDPKPMALVDSLGDFSVIVRVYGWVNQKEFSFAKVSSEAIKKTKKAFDEAGIVMPEPIYQIRVSDTTALMTDASVSSDMQKPNLQQAPEPVKKPEDKHVMDEVADISPDDTAIDQIEEESANGENENLLSPQAPTE
ncbi:mechanosensitive ion channel [Leucothrix sargassi]|nr:mechanosensitive ion channel [Leucothrix sargassi]